MRPAVCRGSGYPTLAGLATIGPARVRSRAGSPRTPIGCAAQQMWPTGQACVPSDQSGRREVRRGVLVGSAEQGDLFWLGCPPEVAGQRSELAEVDTIGDHVAEQFDGDLDVGQARIAGMPVVSGLYTMLVPMVVFALLGSSRHLVVAADSATAAILAAGLVGVAGVGSPRYVQLAGTAALLVGGLLLLARLARLGFLANLLSRTVLVGFLTGSGFRSPPGS